jgi:hypothetical protein
VKQAFSSFLLTICIAQICLGQSSRLQPPQNAIAGNAATISTTGSGEATFYLTGPSHSSKQKVQLGQPIQLRPQDVQSAGKYLAILCSDSCQSAEFYVKPSNIASLAVLAHPSRVPVRQNDAISAVAFTFDEFHNLVLAPLPIKFQLTAGNANLISQTVTTKDGTAWLRTSPGSRAGMAQLVASVGGSGNDVTVRRVVQLVAADPCNLRIKALPATKGIVVATETVRDCAGNPVPDGTIVTFTATDARGKSTVDAPVKQGVARAQINASGSTVISVASGVAMGNELRVEANHE